MGNAQASAATRGKATAAAAAAAPTLVLLDADDADLIPCYEARMASDSRMMQALETIFPHGEDAEDDISLDARVPWWLWLSAGWTRRQLRLIMGVVGVHAGRSHDFLFVKVFCRDGQAHKAGGVVIWDNNF